MNRMFAGVYLQRQQSWQVRRTPIADPSPLTTSIWNISPQNNFVDVGASCRHTSILSTYYQQYVTTTCFCHQVHRGSVPTLLIFLFSFSTKRGVLLCNSYCMSPSCLHVYTVASLLKGVAEFSLFFGTVDLRKRCWGWSASGFDL